MTEIEFPALGDDGLAVLRTRSIRQTSVQFVHVRISGYYVDNYQQYLAKHVNGYRCHANTGVKFPAV